MFVVINSVFSYSQIIFFFTSSCQGKTGQINMWRALCVRRSERIGLNSRAYGGRYALLRYSFRVGDSERGGGIPAAAIAAGMPLPQNIIALLFYEHKLDDLFVPEF